MGWKSENHKNGGGGVVEIFADMSIYFEVKSV